MVSTSFVLLSGLALLSSTVEGSKKFVQRLPNGGNVEGYEAIGHTDGTGKREATNDFGDAFEKAGNKWTLELCQADTDGDGQTNGQELGDPCCEWSQGDTPRWTSGVSHPSDSSLKSDSSLWESINCSAVTTIATGTSGADESLVKQSVVSIIAIATGFAFILA